MNFELTGLKMIVSFGVSLLIAGFPILDESYNGGFAIVGVLVFIGIYLLWSFLQKTPENPKVEMPRWFKFVAPGLSLMGGIGAKYGDHEGSGNKSSKWAMYIGGIVVVFLGVALYFYVMSICPDVMDRTPEVCDGALPFLISISPGLFILVLAVFFHISYNRRYKGVHAEKGQKK